MLPREAVLIYCGHTLALASEWLLLGVRLIWVSLQLSWLVLVGVDWDWSAPGFQLRKKGRVLDRLVISDHRHQGLRGLGIGLAKDELVRSCERRVSEQGPSRSWFRLHLVELKMTLELCL